MKYRKTKVVNYRQEDDDTNTLATCTFLDCDKYRTDHDGQIDTTRQKCTLGIQYKHQVLDQNTERYINIKVCYYKIFIIDICIFLLSYLTD